MRSKRTLFIFGYYMSKRALKKYLADLSKEELEEQVVELYDRLKEVKDFYTFVFNPNEDKRIDEARFKISKEYFPVGKRKPKKRRSVAQKLIKEFIKLGVEPVRIADLMLYNIEIAQTYNETAPITQEAFYRSMLKSFGESVKYIEYNGLETEFQERMKKIVNSAWNQDWMNKHAFDDLLI